MTHSILSNKANEEDDYDMQMMPMMLQPFITLVKNDTHNRVEIHLRGEFGSPQASTKELTELSHLSEKYPTCLVYINSVGGRVDLLREIVALLEKFQHVITVVTSNANSAGFMLWCTGDVRVICPHAELMAHREASGYMDKTDAMVGRAEFLKRRFELMFVDMCGDVLSEEEIDRARYTEVWLLGQDVIDRGVAISWTQFWDQDTAPVEMMSVLSRNGKTYAHTTDGNLVEASIEVDQSRIISYLDVMYGIDPPASIELVEESEEDEVKSDTGIQLSIVDQLHGKVENGKFVVAKEDSMNIYDDEIRAILRAIFGKGNFKVGLSVEAKIDNVFHRIAYPGAYSELDRAFFYDKLNEFLSLQNISLPTE